MTQEKVAVRTEEILDEQGVLLALHFFAPDGRRCNASGRIYHIQTLDEWKTYLAGIASPFDLRKARLNLLNGNQPGNHFHALADGTSELKKAWRYLSNRAYALGLEYCSSARAYITRRT